MKNLDNTFYVFTVFFLIGTSKKRKKSRFLDFEKKTRKRCVNVRRKSNDLEFTFMTTHSAASNDVERVSTSILSYDVFTVNEVNLHHAHHHYHQHRQHSSQ